MLSLIIPPPITLLSLFLVLLFLGRPTTAQILSSGDDPSSVSDGKDNKIAVATTATTTATDPLDVPPAPNNNVKILVCGDSITQGAEGDFTWRYRLWEWFRQANINNNNNNNAEVSSTSSVVTAYNNAGSPETFITPTLQYVGPYSGTLPASVASAIDLADPQTSGPYHPAVDPAFSPGGGSAHFAVYGRPAWMDVDLIQTHVAAYQPDFVVLHLGFNDIGWWGQTAAELIEHMRKLVSNARVGKADVRILVADVSHRLLVQGREDIPVTTDAYNELLGQSALAWTTAESPVVVVKVSEDYDCHVEACPAGIDGLHPNSLGDFQIARAYTKVLHDKYHFGPEPLVVPSIDTIPGVGSSSGIAGFLGTTDASFTYPPIGIFMVGSFLCLVAVIMLRPRLMKALRPSWEGKYQILPMTHTRDTS